MINSFIFLYISSELSFFKIIPSVIVSGNPPLLLIITAQPLLLAYKLDLPNGSSHLEQVTAMEHNSKDFKILLLDL